MVPGGHRPLCVGPSGRLEGSGQVTITIQAHSTDDIVVRLPQRGVASSYNQTILSKEASRMPVIQEELERTFFEKAINDVKKKLSKERGDFIASNTKPVQKA